MAIYHMSFQVISRSQGKSAVAAAAYRAAARYVDQRTGQIFDYTRKSKVDHSEIVLPAGAAASFLDRELLWNRVELSEGRKDSQLAREADIALPVELSPAENIALAKSFCEKHFASMGMIADLNFHGLESGNPHAHIMLTMRELDGENFSKKKNRNWNDKKLLEQWRESWADHVNEVLKKKGIDLIDHRTLEAQGIDREPQIHVGVTGNARTSDSIRREKNLAILARNDDRDLLKSQLKIAKENFEKELKILDRTRNAVSRQALAMGCTHFEIGVRDAVSGKMQLFSATHQTLVKSIDFLRHKNATGSDIYIRPAPENQGAQLVLVDDISDFKLSMMVQRGFKPVVVTETSPQNFQAWIAISDKPMADKALVTAAARALAASFGADMNSADHRHFGRLAGFTNRKPQHKNELGQSPFVLLHGFAGVRAICTWAVEQGRELLAAAQPRPQKRPETPVERFEGLGAAEVFNRVRESLRARYRADFDDSRGDLVACKALLNNGFDHLTAFDTLYASPGLAERKRGHEVDYCIRTVSKASEESEAGYIYPEVLKCDLIDRAKAELDDEPDDDYSPSM